MRQTRCCPVVSGNKGETAVYAMIAVLLITGVFGGGASYLMRRTNAAGAAAGNAAEPGPWAYMLVGVVAAFCVPVFLLITQSKVLKDFETDVIKQDAAGNVALFLDLLYIAGIALIAAYSSRAFMTGVTDQLMQQVRRADEKADNADARAANADHKADTAGARAANAEQKADHAAHQATSGAQKADQAIAKATEVGNQAAAIQDQTQSLKDTIAEVAENLPVTPPPVATKITKADRLLGDDLEVAPESVQLSEPDLRVLRALETGIVAKRIQDGIARDAGLPGTEVEVILRELMDRGLVVAEPSHRSGNPLYQLSAEGRAAIRVAVDAA